MSQFWRASSVTVTNGSEFVSVATGDDVALIRPNALLEIANNQIVEVKTVNTSANPPTIELQFPWNGGSSSGLSAIAVNVGAPRIDALIASTNSLIQVYESVVDDVIGKMGTLLTSTDESVTIETPDGDVEVVPYGYLKNQMDGLFQQFDTDLRRNRIFSLAGVIL